MSLSVLAPALWIVFVLAILISSGFGVVFAYHWVRFSTSTRATAISIVTYFIGVVIFLSIMLILIGTIMFV